MHEPQHSYTHVLITIYTLGKYIDWPNVIWKLTLAWNSNDYNLIETISLNLSVNMCYSSFKTVRV